MYLNEILPQYHFHEVHRTAVRAGPAATMAAAWALKSEEISPLVGGMLALRQLPAKLAGNTGPVRTSQPTFLDSILKGGSMIDLGSREDEILFGMIGQFWKLSQAADVFVQSPAEFRAFCDPGYAKVAANIAVQAQGENTLLSTETRIWAPDEATRRKFSAYWRIISAGSGWIRMLWLDAIKRKAEGVY